MFRRKDAGLLHDRPGRTPLVNVMAILAFGLLFLPARAAGEHGAMPPLESGPSLWSRTISATADEPEFHITLRGSAPGTSWEKPGQETAVLQLFVDRQYDQHVFLAGGEMTLEYDFIAGPLSPGDHVLELRWQRNWTPALKRTPQLQQVNVQPLRRADESLESVFRAPIIYLRPDTVGRFSDVPLLLYCEHGNAQNPAGVTYTIILSNEDGGTNTERLMARWGRTTDIEWCYAYAQRSGVLEETYQGRDHETLPFRGAYDGSHPRLFDASRNNIFADQPSASETVRVRLFPFHQDLKGKTRESVMDTYPWIYPLMAREMIREGKFEDPADVTSARVSDLRNYAYVDVCARQHGTELRFEVKLREGETWYSSDHGDPKARIDRSGCFRSSVELPHGTGSPQLSALKIECLEAPPAEGKQKVANPEVLIESVGPLFLLQESYEPAPAIRLQAVGATSLTPGKSLELAVGR